LAVSLLLAYKLATGRLRSAARATS
jgi:hypothetical protein